jgi:hypothetical protein
MFSNLQTSHDPALKSAADIPVFSHRPRFDDCVSPGCGSTFGCYTIPNMKIMLLSVLCFCSLLLAGCVSSSGNVCKSSSPAATTKSSVYDPATDTTTIKNGGNTWYVKGNQTNLMLEAKP